jgi:1-acyl-sn-glycerol-3-phosphate acyltransferase
MVRTFFWYTLGWSYFVITMPLLLRVKYLDKRGRFVERDKLANAFSMHVSRVLFKLTGSKLKLIGEENLPKDKPVLFVSNHQGHMDSVIIHGFINIPKGFVSIIEVKKFPILRSWMYYSKCIFLDRNDPRQILECINMGIQFLKQGHSMVIFPEGKLSEGLETDEFKNGSLRLALKAGVPIIPITIKGSYKIMSKLGRDIKPAYVECFISKPIEKKNVDKSGEKDLLDQVRNAIIEKL